MLLAARTPKMESRAVPFNYDLSRMKENVEGKDSKTVLTLSGTLTPEEIIKALMDVDTSNSVPSKF